MKIRILICDDDETMVFLLTSMLKNNGYCVDGITQMDDFMDRVKAFDPDMILMDLSMPKINGEEAIKILDKDNSTAHIPVILMSASSNIEKLAQQLNKLYIKKPFDIDEFRSILSMFAIC